MLHEIFLKILAIAGRHMPLLHSSPEHGSLCKISCSCSLYYLPSGRHVIGPRRQKQAYNSDAIAAKHQTTHTHVFLSCYTSILYAIYLYPGSQRAGRAIPFTETGNHHFVSLVTCLRSGFRRCRQRGGYYVSPPPS